MTERTYLVDDWFPWPLPSNVVIGDGGWFYSAYAFLHYRSRRPCGVRIGRWCTVGVDTMFMLGPSGEVEMGDHSILVQASFTVNSRVVIGQFAMIAHEVVFADHFAAVPPPASHTDSSTALPPEPETSIVVGDNAWIGFRAVLLAGARIGEGAIVGAGTVVDFEVPPYAVVAGNPARIVSWALPNSTTNLTATNGPVF